MGNYNKYNTRITNIKIEEGTYNGYKQSFGI